MKSFITNFLIGITILYSGALYSCSNDNLDSDDFEKEYGFYTIDIPTISEPEFTTNEKVVNNSINNLGINTLFKLSQNKSKNLLTAPISTSLAISMRANIKNTPYDFSFLYELLNYTDINDINSTLIKLIRFLPDESNGVDFILGNSIWSPSGLYGEEKAFADSYFAEQYLIDPDLDKLNKKGSKWVELKTNGLIKKCPTLDSNASLITINTLYFKGEWENKFDRNKTFAQSFSTPNGDVDVDMMHSETINIPYVSSERFEAVKLPFKGNYDMILILPEKNIFMMDFLADFPADIVENLDCEKRKINLALPKFSYEYKFDLVKTLFKDRIPNFKCVQNCVIEVDEDGAKAAAVTVTGDSLGYELTFNRPFLFMIVNRVSDTNLFMGCVFDPTSKSGSSDD